MAINPADGMSYTNRDFQTMYNELLDIADKISYKWKPSVSNESDPGVVLIKENALQGDKLSYNLDKNILETLPQTVQETTVARSLFESLGYNMKWYKGATGEISLSWVGPITLTSDEESYISNARNGQTSSFIPSSLQGIYELYKLGLYDAPNVIVPKYTMVSDTENKIIYTLLEDCTFSFEDKTYSYNISAIQGIFTPLKILSNTTITLQNLDSTNRIFFNDYLVAENGIFINNIGDSIDTWTPSDNLAIELPGTRVYHFGVDSYTGLPYVQFPDDISSLIGDGLNINYIVTQGSEGNITAKYLDTFYNSPEDRFGKIKFTPDNVLIKNNSSITNGEEPESVESGYKNYMKTVGVFKTLVTLRDYTNAIYESGYVSNDKVTDKYNDIQNSFYIVSEQDLVNTNVLKTNDNIFQGFVDENYGMNEFDLKLYLLSKVDNPTNNLSYHKTFSIDNSVQTQTAIKEDLKEIKTINHTYKDFVPSITEENHPENLVAAFPIIFQNDYLIKCKIATYNNLNRTDMYSVKVNIISAIWKELNSRKLEFGEEVTYDLVYEVIKNADSRIKDVILSDIDYTTYAVIAEDNNDTINLKSIPINGDAYENLPIQALHDKNIADYIRKDIKVKSVLAGVTPLYIKDNTFLRKINQSNKDIFDNLATVNTNLELEFLSNSSNSGEYEIKPHESIVFAAPNYIEDIKYSVWTKYELFLADTEISSGITETYETLGTYFDERPSWRSNTYYEKNGDTYTLLTAEPDDWRNEGYWQRYYIKTAHIDLNETDITYILVTSNPTFEKDKYWYFTDPVGKIIKLISAPEKLEEQISDNNVYVISNGETKIPANTLYQLKDSEYLNVFYQPEQDSDYYQYISYGAGTVIKSNTTQTTTPEVNILDSAQRAYNDTPREGKITRRDSTQYTKITNPTFATSQVLDTSSYISIMKANTEKISYDLDNYIYWITNLTKTEIDSETGLRTDSYILSLNREVDSETNVISGSVILEPGEYFITSSKSKADITIFGSGTKINFNNLINDNPLNPSDPYELLVTAVDYSDIATNGIEALKDAAISITDKLNKPTETIPSNIILEEMLLTTIGEGYKIALSGYDNDLTIDSNSFTPLSNNVTINYFEPGSNNSEQLPIYDISIDGHPVGYSVKTYFSLETSPEVPMTIYPTATENHVTATRTITFPKGIEDNAVSTLDTPKTIESGSENIYLMTSPSISVLGGHETSIYSINAKGDLQGVSLRSFIEKSPSGSSNLDVNELLDNSIEWKIPDGSSSFTLTYSGVKLEKGNYILPIINSNYFTDKEEIEYIKNEPSDPDPAPIWIENTYYKKDPTSNNFTLTLSEPDNWGTDYTKYYTRKYNHTMSTSVQITDASGDITSYGKKNIVYYKFSINDNDSDSPITHNISISADCFKDSSDTYKGGTIYIKPLVKYSPNPNFTDSVPEDSSLIDEDLLDHLKKLDSDEDFNLTYDVPDEVKILNPIDANSFNDPNHIYNKFTLCEAVIKEDDTVSSVIMINKK